MLLSQLRQAESSLSPIVMNAESVVGTTSVGGGGVDGIIPSEHAKGMLCRLSILRCFDKQAASSLSPEVLNDESDHYLRAHVWVMVQRSS
jgi:hypothetical protein